MLLLLVLGVAPALVTLATFALSFQRAAHVTFCADCHTMTPWIADLENPKSKSLAAMHFGNRWIQNDQCYTCHADKRGPFLFEHAPVRENCLNCHAPHGSNFESLLTTARPVLCQQCHAQTGHPASLMTMGNIPLGPNPDQRLIGVSCQTCHSEIHGSNSPAGARFER